MRRSVRRVTTYPQLPGGALEYAVLLAIFDLGRASAREIHARAGEPKGLVYTTTTKVLDRLLAKRLARRRPHGRTFLYEPAIERSMLERARAREVLAQLFGDTPLPAMATLVDAMESMDSALLDELAREVSARRRRRRGS